MWQHENTRKLRSRKLGAVQDGEYGDVSVKCKINREAHFATAGNLNLRNYRIEITAGGKTTPISVMHVNNWKDQTTVDAKALKTLVAHIN